MSDRWVLVLAAATAAGAAWARPIAGPLVVGVVALAVLGARRGPPVACAAALLLASSLSARAWSGLDPPRPAFWSGTAVLASDPAPAFGAVRAEMRLGRRRVEAWARAGPAALLAPRLAGERVQVSGRLRPVTGKSRAYLARRHIAARFTVQSVGRVQPAPLPVRVANGVRRTILHGARVMPERERSLFAGFVLGDQRAESEDDRNAFRAAGLSHLLVVSGANVAFVLALLQPLLRRLRLGPRFLAAACVLALFVLVTRGEPSVLRAGSMAALALLAATLGRPVSTQRLLCLAVTGLLLADPLLVGSAGFLLSVAATAGIAWLTPVLHRWVPLPVAVTAAAQLGVAPVLIPMFGGLPVVSLPANLLAIPAAGPVMMWGLAAGLPAGLLPAPVAAVLHLPTRLLVSWVAAVAQRAAAAGERLGELDGRHLVAFLVIAGVGVLASAGRRIASRGAPRSRSP
jgi:competence protein ComEC